MRLLSNHDVSDGWRPGPDVILRRVVLNDGRVWLEFPVIVVRGALVIRRRERHPHIMRPP